MYTIQSSNLWSATYRTPWQKRPKKELIQTDLFGGRDFVNWIDISNFLAYQTKNNPFSAYQIIHCNTTSAFTQHTVICYFR